MCAKVTLGCAWLQYCITWLCMATVFVMLRINKAGKIIYSYQDGRGAATRESESVRSQRRRARQDCECWLECDRKRARRRKEREGAGAREYERLRAWRRRAQTGSQERACRLQHNIEAEKRARGSRSKDTVYSSFLHKFESLPCSKALWPSVTSYSTQGQQDQPTVCVH